MKKLACYVGALSFCALLAACGGRGSQPSTSIKVTMTDFQFTLNSFTVPAGQQINFTATNNGGVEHSFVIMKLGSEVKDHFTGQDQVNVYCKKTEIGVGQTVNATFTAPNQPGDYQVVCAVPGHFEAGMVATLKVIKGS